MKRLIAVAARTLVIAAAPVSSEVAAPDCAEQREPSCQLHQTAQNRDRKDDTRIPRPPI